MQQGCKPKTMALLRIGQCIGQLLCSNKQHPATLQHENIQCYQYSAETEKVGKGEREVGGRTDISTLQQERLQT